MPVQAFGIRFILTPWLSGRRPQSMKLPKFIIIIARFKQVMMQYLFVYLL